MILRACIVALICTIISACAHIPIEHRTAIRAHSSFVIVHQIGIFKTELCDNGQDCAPLGPPVKLEMGVGSGGVVGHGDSSTYILTAKHVVASLSGTPQINEVLLERLVYENAGGTDMEPESVQKLVDEGSVRFTPVGFEYVIDFSDGIRSSVTGSDCDPHNDICLIEVPHRADVARIRISPVAPYVGETVICAAAPFGQAVPELQVVPLFHGLFSGTDVKTLEFPAHSWYTFPSAPGSSGSLILNESGELVGLVVGMSVGHFCGREVGCAPMTSGITIAVPHSALAEFLNERLK